MSGHPKSPIRWVVALSLGLGLALWIIGDSVRNTVVGTLGAVLAFVGIVAARVFVSPSQMIILNRFKFFGTPMSRKSRRNVILLGIVLIAGTLGSFAGLFIGGPNAPSGYFFLYAAVVLAVGLAGYAAIVFFLPW